MAVCAPASSPAPLSVPRHGTALTREGGRQAAAPETKIGVCRQVHTAIAAITQLSGVLARGQRRQSISNCVGGLCGVVRLLCDWGCAGLCDSFGRQVPNLGPLRGPSRCPSMEPKQRLTTTIMVFMPEFVNWLHFVTTHHIIVPVHHLSEVAIIVNGKIHI